MSFSSSSESLAQSQALIDGFWNNRDALRRARMEEAAIPALAAARRLVRELVKPTRLPAKIFTLAKANAVASHWLAHRADWTGNPPD